MIKFQGYRTLCNMVTLRFAKKANEMISFKKKTKDSLPTPRFAKKANEMTSFNKKTKDSLPT